MLLYNTYSCEVCRASYKFVFWGNARASGGDSEEHFCATAARSPRVPNAQCGRPLWRLHPELQSKMEGILGIKELTHPSPESQPSRPENALATQSSAGESSEEIPRGPVRSCFWLLSRDLKPMIAEVTLKHQSSPSAVAYYF